MIQVDDQPVSFTMAGVSAMSFVLSISIAQPETMIIPVGFFILTVFCITKSAYDMGKINQGDGEFSEEFNRKEIHETMNN